MAHRIEIELTSNSGNGTWTWRAAGAKLPRGHVPAELVPDGTAVGTVLRAEVESTLDGTTVLSLQPPKPKGEVRATGRIEIAAVPQSGPDVNVILAPKGRGRGRDDRGRDRDRDDRPGGRGDGARRPSTGGRSRGPGGPGTDGGRGGPRDGTGRGGRPDARSGASGRPTGGRDRPARPGADGPRRLAQSSTYRNAALAELKPEQLPVAEQLLRGGIPAVRQAIEEQNARAKEDGRAEVTPGPLLALAEELLPVVNLAAWKDRASSARAAGKDAPLRELRSIVASANTVTLDDEGRELATALRASLDERVTALREGWVSRIVAALDDGRVADAVRTANRPPEHGTRLSAELAVRLAGATGAAMSAETPPAEWTALLELVVEAPFRRTVKPAGIPTGADETLLAAARQASGYVPELARLLGIPIPPPPGPRRPVPTRRPAAGRPA